LRLELNNDLAALTLSSLQGSVRRAGRAHASNLSAGGDGLDATIARAFVNWWIPVHHTEMPLFARPDAAELFKPWIRVG
ncbi:MAG TPA: hypothetical protein VL424_07990, partial [Pararobbsia sp.]|nr:hypothetical protein [Pararobbsia sp.]